MSPPPKQRNAGKSHRGCRAELGSHCLSYLWTFRGGQLLPSPRRLYAAAFCSAKCLFWRARGAVAAPACMAALSCAVPDSLQSF